jgi:predicted transcriptional regulator
MPDLEEPKTSPGTKVRTRNTRALIAVVGTLATALGGYAAKRAQDTDDDVAKQAAVTKQQLDDHVKQEAEHHADVKEKLEQLDKGNRRPAEEDFEPAGPPGERP